ncbi:MAG TPA: hypothetical protein VFY16_02930, partial [Gemmatimonadaceae bacterium]|nr:hypothetical protein [Gemmatimonadaceae bacterium]
MTTVDAHPSAGILHILLPKWRTARARARQRDAGAGARRVVLALLGLGFWIVLFTLVQRLLGYFKDVEEIGPLLAGKMLGVVLLALFSLLLLSNVVTALSTGFLARDLDLLAAAPVDWLRLYLAKLLETTLHSS